jgi:ribonucleoside-diphosphate reductase alpha subunit
MFQDLFSGLPNVDKTKFSSPQSILKLYLNYETEDPQYSLLAGRALMHSLEDWIPSSFSDFIFLKESILNKDYLHFVESNKDTLNQMIIKENDYQYPISAMKKFVQMYLHKEEIGGEQFTIESPQYLFLRNASFLWYPNLEKIKQVYTSMSNIAYIHATPNLLNAGTKKSQLMSCFIGHISDDMVAISSWYSQVAFISSVGGGLALNYSSIRSSGLLRGEGKSNTVPDWILPMKKILPICDQGKKRKGNLACYLSIWHKDIYDFIMMREPIGEHIKAKNLFYAVWICDLFMERLLRKEKWSLFSPELCGDLPDLYGHSFNLKYLELEKKKLYHKQVDALDLWKFILGSCLRNGIPYVLFSDNINRKNNQMNIGIIRSSNLCCEIMEHTSDKEIASCNLGSIVLDTCIVDGHFNFDLLDQRVRELVQNLNQVIDKTYYPSHIPQIKYANLKNRPIAIGLQGLANTFLSLGFPWESKEARKLNRDIAEQMYFSAMDESCNEAEKYGPYEEFQGSPTSMGLFQFDLWNLEKKDRNASSKGYQPEPIPSSYMISSGRWEALRERMRKGIRNSLLIAPMPTKSTSTITMRNECFEPFTHMVFTEDDASGTSFYMNPVMVNHLKGLGCWNSDTLRKIMENSSLQNLDIPPSSKALFKTVFEIDPYFLQDMYIDSAPFIDQSRSFNLWLKKPDLSLLSSLLIRGWKNGLKTGSYYTTQKVDQKAINVSLDSLKFGVKSPPRPLRTCSDDICYSCQ